MACSMLAKSSLPILLLSYASVAIEDAALSGSEMHLLFSSSTCGWPCTGEYRMACQGTKSTMHPVLEFNHVCASCNVLIHSNDQGASAEHLLLSSWTLAHSKTDCWELYLMKFFRRPMDGCFPLLQEGLGDVCCASALACAAAHAL